jgi:hypothetical protein
LAVTGIVLGLASSANADDKGKARELFKDGTRLYDVGDYREALQAFKKTYLLYEEPALLINMAQCYR